MQGLEVDDNQNHACNGDDVVLWEQVNWENWNLDKNGREEKFEEMITAESVASTSIVVVLWKMLTDSLPCWLIDWMH